MKLHRTPILLLGTVFLLPLRAYAASPQEGSEHSLHKHSHPHESAHRATDALKITGYVQGQYEWHDDCADGTAADPIAGCDAVDAKGKTLNPNQFRVRRARIKTTYTATRWLEAMIQLEGAGDGGVELRDAEVSVIEPWTSLKLRVVVGQMKVPFGFEIGQSSTKREWMERSRVTRTLFPGERDRGFKAGGALEFGDLHPFIWIGAFNGTLIGDKVFPASDPSANKAFLAQAGVTAHGVRLGFSAWRGKNFLPGKEEVSASTAWNDANENSMIDMGEVTSSAARPKVASAEATQWRLGLDAEVDVDVPTIGKFGFRAEYLEARDGARSSAFLPKSVRSRGWYAAFAQHFGEVGGLGFRVDQFDRDLDAKNSMVTTYAPVAFVQLGSHLKVSAEYDHVRDHLQGAAPGGSSGDLANDVFIVRAQGEF